MIYSKITPYTQPFKPFQNVNRWISIWKRTSRCRFYIYIPEFKTENKKKLKQKRFLSWKGKIYIYCRISCTINGFIIIIVNLSMTLFNILFWTQRLCYIYCIPQIVKWNICNEVFGSPFTFKKVHVSLSIRFPQPVD